VIVTTDSSEIADAARAAGAEVPFMRPAELASDSARSIDAILHAIDWHEKAGFHFDLVLVLQPTSPLRTQEDIDQAIEVLFARQALATVSVCETEHHPWWSNTLPADGSMLDFLRPEVLNNNRQDLPPVYRLNGAIYLVDIRFLQSARSFYGPATFAFIMPAERSVDIDSLLDFHLAEAILSDIAQQSP